MCYFQPKQYFPWCLFRCNIVLALPWVIPLKVSYMDVRVYSVYSTDNTHINCSVIEFCVHCVMCITELLQVLCEFKSFVLNVLLWMISGNEIIIYLTVCSSYCPCSVRGGGCCCGSYIRSGTPIPWTSYGFTGSKGDTLRCVEQN